MAVSIVAFALVASGCAVDDDDDFGGGGGEPAVEEDTFDPVDDGAGDDGAADEVAEEPREEEEGVPNQENPDLQFADFDTDPHSDQIDDYVPADVEALFYEDPLRVDLLDPGSIDCRVDVSGQLVDESGLVPVGGGILVDDPASVPALEERGIVGEAGETTKVATVTNADGETVRLYASSVNEAAVDDFLEAAIVCFDLTISAGELDSVDAVNQVNAGAAMLRVAADLFLVHREDYPKFLSELADYRDALSVPPDDSFDFIDLIGVLLTDDTPPGTVRRGVRQSRSGGRGPGGEVGRTRVLGARQPVRAGLPLRPGTRRRAQCRRGIAGQRSQLRRDRRRRTARRHRRGHGVRGVHCRWMCRSCSAPQRPPVPSTAPTTETCWPTTASRWWCSWSQSVRQSGPTTRSGWTSTSTRSCTGPARSTSWRAVCEPGASRSTHRRLRYCVSVPVEPVHLLRQPVRKRQLEAALRHRAQEQDQLHQLRRQAPRLARRHRVRGDWLVGRRPRRRLLSEFGARSSPHASAAVSGSDATARALPWAGR